MSKFAPMTAGLLARKGEALPSSYFSMPPPRLVSAPAGDLTLSRPARMPNPIVMPSPSHHHVDATRHRHHETDRPHKLRVALSDAEYEKFGLAAVKHNVTRPQLIREALDSYVEKLLEMYRGDCQCIGGDGACGSGGSCGPL